MLKRLVMLTLLVSLLGTIPGCAWLDTLLGAPATATNRYLFIETWAQWQVEVLRGSFGLMIDIPTYQYDADKQTLDVGLVDPKLSSDKSFMALWGDGISLQVKNGEGGGASSAITGIYQLPFRETARSFELLRIEPNGMATVRFQGEERTLKPGESWQTTTEPSLEQVDNNILKESYTYIIRNFGWWPRQKLHLARGSS